MRGVRACKLVLLESGSRVGSALVRQKKAAAKVMMEVKYIIDVLTFKFNELLFDM